MPSSGGVEVCCILCCFISIFVAGVIGWQNYRNLPVEIEIAKLWASPQNGASWVQETCTVHSAGISSQGGCWEPAPKQGLNLMLQLNRDPLLPDKFSVCPGIFWCADEGGSCDKCPGGDVLYSEFLFHGNQPVDHTIGESGEALRETLLKYKVPTGAGVTVHGADEPVHCAHGDGEPFKEDPAPAKKKACFCTPRNVVDLLRDKGPIEPSGQNCATLANQAFLSETKHRRLREQMVSGQALNSTSQQWMYPEGYCRAEDLSNILVNDAYGLNQDYKVYLNWALVEVQGTGNSSKTNLRCAYEYGAQFASREDNDVVKDIYQAWNQSTPGKKVPCYVRKGGACGESSCAVALEDPSKLYENQPAFGPIAPVLMMILGCCPYLLCCLAAFAAAAARQGGAQQASDQQAQPLSQNSDAEGVAPPGAASGGM